MSLLYLFWVGFGSLFCFADCFPGFYGLNFDCCVDRFWCLKAGLSFVGVSGVWFCFWFAVVPGF